MDSFGKCLWVSMGLFIGAALVSQYTYQYWSYLQIAILIAITFISGLYTLIKYAPKDNPNKIISDPKEIRKFKIMSLTYLFLWLIAGISLTTLKINIYAISSALSILLSLFTITPAGHKFFDFINYGFNLNRHNDLTS